MASGINAIANLLGKVDANGALLVSLSGGTATATTFVGPAADNTAAVPFTFTSDTNTGLASAAADTVNVVTGGTSRLAISTTAITSTLPVLFPDGLAATPSIALANNTGLGFYRLTSGIIAASNGANPVFAWANGSTNFTLSATSLLQFGSSGISSPDVEVSRAAANRLRLATGDVFNLQPTVFGSLPTGAEGDLASVTDSSTATWGATITGGGANNVLAYFNGANWTVAGA